jgi:hypothetical protein
MTTAVNKDKATGENKTFPHRKEQIVEVSVFLFLIVPSMIISFFAAQQGIISFVLIAVSSILRDLADIQRVRCQLRCIFQASKGAS